MVFLISLASAQQSPHGEKLAFSCTDCHTTEGWKFSALNATFSHDLTKFKLEGLHFYTDCKACHKTLVFSETKSNCIDCHTDMHNNTVGPNCAECHTPKSWIVENITEIHQRSRFPLLGAHNTADCAACHTSVSNLEFQPLGVECIDCHNADYQATTKPNHVQSGFSTNCIECHRIDAFEWSATGINHDFFPLTKGHEVENCAACHTSGVTVPISADCSSCHQNDYNNAKNPSHQNSGFSTSCAECHTTEPDWKPAEFKTHDALYFPVYSGSHKGEWNSCADCHTQPENYNQFSCIDCHEHNKSDMDSEHRGENGYSYNSNACFACHPNGNEDGAFNHDVTGFQLKGAHIQTTCLDCHSSGFAGTSSTCKSCHTDNYNEATNPNHKDAGITNECEDCHTETSWGPSLFDHTTSSGFELSGGHLGKQCSECHVGNTTSASSECISCHQANYNEAENHLSQNYPKECLQCHTTTNWEDADFDHNLTEFPLTGSHTATECSACHTNGYAGTSTLCNSCHTDNYTAAQNPSHSAAGISTECETCHNTNPGWEPASFPTHNDYYALNGAHAKISSDCFLCHEGNYNTTKNTCYECHTADYNATKDPAHLTAQFPKECAECHTETAWEPSTFNHDSQYFPIYSGKHQGEWNLCAECHTVPTNYSVFSCTDCHEHNKTDMDKEHEGENGYVYNSINCYACHPKGDS